MPQTRVLCIIPKSACHEWAHLPTDRIPDLPNLLKGELATRLSKIMERGPVYQWPPMVTVETPLFPFQIPDSFKKTNLRVWHYKLGYG